MNGGMLPALIVSTLAGLSTGIGGSIACLSRRSSERFLSGALGFSAGVMILVCFEELLPDSKKSLAGEFGTLGAPIAAAVSLLAGAVLAMLIGRLVPEGEMPHKKGKAGFNGTSELARVGTVTAIAVTLHNLPEGIATFMAGYADLRLGLPVAVAIALHNIPEGIAIAVPIFFGTGSRRRALSISLLSGLSEPFGALLAFLILSPFLNDTVLGAIFGMVAGIMIFISFDSLLPSAQRNGHTVASVIGIFSGFLFMELAMSVFGL